MIPDFRMKIPEPFIENVNNIIEIMNEVFLLAAICMLFAMNSASKWTDSNQDIFLAILSINSVMIVLVNVGK